MVSTSVEFNYTAFTIEVNTVEELKAQLENLLNFTPFTVIQSVQFIATQKGQNFKYIVLLILRTESNQEV